MLECQIWALRHSCLLMSFVNRLFLVKFANATIWPKWELTLCALAATRQKDWRNKVKQPEQNRCHLSCQAPKTVLPVRFLKLSYFYYAKCVDPLVQKQGIRNWPVPCNAHHPIDQSWWRKIKCKSKSGNWYKCENSCKPIYATFSKWMPINAIDIYIKWVIYLFVLEFVS